MWAKFLDIGAAAAYALIALALRLVMARVFFLTGQEKIQGLGVSLRLFGLDFSFVLPAEIKPAAFQMFEAHNAVPALPPATTAYLFTYAEFVLPICLVLGFASRLAALALLAMTVLLQVYVVPALWWSQHVYWISILAVLVTLGPGILSVDALLRHVYRRDQLANGA